MTSRKNIIRFQVASKCSINKEFNLPASGKLDSISTPRLRGRFDLGVKSFRGYVIPMKMGIQTGKLTNLDSPVKLENDILDLLAHPLCIMNAKKMLK